MNISEDLKKQAIKLKLCEEWTDNWGNPNLDELVEMYKEGIDFAILHNYPSNEYIKEHFGTIAENHGVFTDRDNLQISGLPTIIINGNTNGKIRLNGFDVSSVYVRHDSEVHVQVKDSAKASIRVYDNASVTIDNMGNSKVYVYKYGGKVYSSGNVIIKERKLNELG